MKTFTWIAEWKAAVLEDEPHPTHRRNALEATQRQPSLRAEPSPHAEPSLHAEPSPYAEPSLQAHAHPMIPSQVPPWAVASPVVIVVTWIMILLVATSLA